MLWSIRIRSNPALIFWTMCVQRIPIIFIVHSHADSHSWLSGFTSMQLAHLPGIKRYIYIKSLTSTVYIYILYSPIIINNPQCLLVNIPAFPKISSLRCTPRCSRSPHQESGAPRCCDRSYGLETSQETHGFSHEIWEFPTLENQFWET